MRRGAGGTAWAVGTLAAVGGAAAAMGLGAAEVAGADTGGAATTTVGRAGGADRIAASVCLRSRIALSASPGFETFERSNFGLLSTTGLLEPVARAPGLK
jgi:hypothetical protein